MIDYNSIDDIDDYAHDVYADEALMLEDSGIYDSPEC